MKNDGIVNIHGKDYKTVALRVGDFKNDFPDYSILTEIIESTSEIIVMKASIIKNPEGTIMATGHAEEKRNSTQINRTSALENCETSAIGRAIALMGHKYMGTEFCSANELENALHQQKKETKKEPEHKKTAPSKFHEVKGDKPAEKSVDMKSDLAKRFYSICNEKGIDEELQKEIVLQMFDKHSRTELTEKELKQLVEYIVPRGKEWLITFSDIARITKAKFPHIRSASALMFHLKGTEELNTSSILEVGTESLMGYCEKIKGAA